MLPNKTVQQGGRLPGGTGKGFLRKVPFGLRDGEEEMQKYSPETLGTYKKLNLSSWRGMDYEAGRIDKWHLQRALNTEIRTLFFHP